MFRSIATLLTLNTILSSCVTVTFHPDSYNVELIGNPGMKRVAIRKRTKCNWFTSDEECIRKTMPSIRDKARPLCQEKTPYLNSCTLIFSKIYVALI